MRERREEDGRREGDEAARTDGCCQGSAPFVAKTNTSSGLLKPKAFLLATLTLYLVAGCRSFIVRLPWKTFASLFLSPSSSFSPSFSSFSSISTSFTTQASSSLACPSLCTSTLNIWIADRLDALHWRVYSLLWSLLVGLRTIAGDAWPATVMVFKASPTSFSALHW